MIIINTYDCSKLQTDYHMQVCSYKMLLYHTVCPLWGRRFISLLFLSLRLLFLILILILHYFSFFFFFLNLNMKGSMYAFT